MDTDSAISASFFDDLRVGIPDLYRFDGTDPHTAVTVPAVTGFRIYWFQYLFAHRHLLFFPMQYRVFTGFLFLVVIQPSVPLRSGSAIAVSR